MGTPTICTHLIGLRQLLQLICRGPRRRRGPQLPLQRSGQTLPQAATLRCKCCRDGADRSAQGGIGAVAPQISSPACWPRQACEKQWPRHACKRTAVACIVCGPPCKLTHPLCITPRAARQSSASWALTGCGMTAGYAAAMPLRSSWQRLSTDATSKLKAAWPCRCASSCA